MMSRLLKSVVAWSLLGSVLCSPAQAELRNHLPDLLTMAKPGSVHSWLAFEAAHSRDLDSLFYADRSADSKHALIARALRYPLPLEALSVLSQSWRQDFATVAQNLEGWSSRFDGMDVSMWYVFDDRPWVTRMAEDRLHLALNARAFLPYDQTRTRLRFSDVLFHVAIDRAAKQNIQDESLARRVQLEGLKLATAAEAVPGHPEHVYIGCDAQTLAPLKQQKGRLMRQLMSALQRRDRGDVARFFPPGKASDLPPCAGRYLAFALAQALAGQHNMLELALIPSDDYLFLVKGQIEEGVSVVNEQSAALLN